MLESELNRRWTDKRIHELNDKSEHDLLLLTAQSALRTEQHLKTLNGKVQETCIIVAKQGEIIEENECRSKDNAERLNKMVLALIALFGGVVAAFITGYAT